MSGKDWSKGGGKIAKGKIREVKGDGEGEGGGHNSRAGTGNPISPLTPVGGGVCIGLNGTESKTEKSRCTFCPVPFFFSTSRIVVELKTSRGFSFEEDSLSMRAANSRFNCIELTLTIGQRCWNL